MNCVIPSSTVYTYLFVSTTYEKEKDIFKRDVRYESEEKILANRLGIPLISLMQFYCAAIYFHTFFQGENLKMSPLICYCYSISVQVVS